MKVEGAAGTAVEGSLREEMTAEDIQMVGWEGKMKVGMPPNLEGMMYKEKRFVN